MKRRSFLIIKCLIYVHLKYEGCSENNVKIVKTLHILIVTHSNPTKNSSENFSIFRCGHL